MKTVRSSVAPIVQHHLESFLARTRAEDEYGSGVPDWIEEDFRAYLRCGILAHGFARIVEVAAHLTDAVLPPLPLRQWVLSLPKRLRPYLPHDPQLAGAILCVLLRALQTRLRRTSPGSGSDACLGAISFLHRFGASLNPHFHFHVVVLDAAGPIRRVLCLPARPLPDGRSVLALSPLEFLAALARLIPPPRVHRHRCAERRVGHCRTVEATRPVTLQGDGPGRTAAPPR